ncbi:tripartite tricarboxylate transporter substrate binding protein [Pigmentiphaga sp. H8]|uniref:Bug family tripartite tricarboxylate transporter substrate binding protein n=1 Tax=Pigmentiphaga sp. H8 TaxID=2488560 RepID=UPI000F598D66|nr:tripartite tricarboxylate transporter substrate binding protein [Pigmentiphaga sp. H8]AZG08236.1 tripartite tricarboxylate transporter substrate binding protein [Pigmentiphaga sp. H8]
MRPWMTRTLLAASLAASQAATCLAADSYPSRPIRIIVNTAPGGYTDGMTRLFAQHMGEYLKQSVVVENRAGGDGLIGIRTAKAAQADGYTLLGTTATVAQQMALRQDPGYDVAKDFVAVGALTRSPFLVMESPSKPDRSLVEFMARAKANPGKVLYASAGVGTGSHMAAAQFLRQTGLDLVHVPYKGNAPALPDVTGGRVDMIFTTFDSAGPQAKAGQFRVLAIASNTRHPAFPDVPTIAETGAADYTAYTWVGLLAPAGTPPQALAKLGEALRYTRSLKAVQDRLRQDGTEIMDLTGAQFNEFLMREVAAAQELMTDLGMQKQ